MFIQYTCITHTRAHLFIVVLVVILLAALKLRSLVTGTTITTESTQAVHHLFVAQVLVRHPPTEVQNLPKRHGKRPDVAFCRVLALKRVSAHDVGKALLFNKNICHCDEI